MNSLWTLPRFAAEFGILSVNANSFSVAWRTEPVASLTRGGRGEGVGSFPPWPWAPGETTDGPAMVERCYVNFGRESMG